MKTIKTNNAESLYDKDYYYEYDYRFDGTEYSKTGINKRALIIILIMSVSIASLFIV